MNSNLLDNWNYLRQLDNDQLVSIGLQSGNEIATVLAERLEKYINDHYIGDDE